MAPCPLPIGKAKRAHTEMPTDAGEDRIWVDNPRPQPLVVVESYRNSRVAAMSLKTVVDSSSDEKALREPASEHPLSAESVRRGRCRPRCGGPDFGPTKGYGAPRRSSL